MTPTFADSSALVTLYADEPGARFIRAASTLLVSQLARVEVPSALWRKHRIRELSISDTGILVEAFEADYFGADDEKTRFLIVAITPEILDDASRLVGVHGLRAYDAVQLASARAARAATTENMSFAAFDAALCRAAAAEGFELVSGRGF